MKIIATVLALAALLSGPCFVASPPNIVILYADDMGYGDLGANNPASKITRPGPPQPLQRDKGYINAEIVPGKKQ